MIKTKLGLSNCLVAAMFYFFISITLFMNTSVFALPTLVLGGYVLAKEDDVWLKASVIKGIFLAVFVSIIVLILFFSNDIINFINFFLRIAKVTQINDGFGITNWFKEIIYVIEKIFFILLAFMALGGKTIKLPVIDNVIMKHI